MNTNTTHLLIAAAIAPLKQFAIDRAETMMRAQIERTLGKIAEADDDLNAVYPYPDSKVSREKYRSMENAHNFASKITTYHSSKNPNGFSHYRGPKFVERCEDGIARVIEEVRDMAAQSFEAYAAKLTGKIGDGITSAVTHQRDLWYDSDLTVERTDGSVEVWNTKIITNYSRYGLAFNQFPTRKMKR
jgi:hypothetical protein